MRIAYVVSEFPSISQTPVLNQIVEMVKRGHEVHIYPRWRGKTDVAHGDILRYSLLDHTRYPVYVPKPKAARVKAALSVLSSVRAEECRILFRTLDIRRFGVRAANLQVFFDVVPFLGSREYDVVHCQFGTNAAYALRAASVGALKGPLVTSFRGYDVLTYPREAGLTVYRQLFEQGFRFTANTSFLAHRLFELGCPAERTNIIHSIHNIGACKFRERNLRPGETVEMVTVARLVEGKGIEYAIRACGQVISRFPNIRYRIVGDGPLRGELQRVIEDNRLTDIVDLMGWRSHDEVRAIYDEAHFFILPSINDSNGWVEAQGVVLQEAQALGLPVIASRVGGIPEGVKEGESAILVPEKNVQALTSAIEALIDNSDRWPMMGRAGKRFVDDRFSTTKLTDQLLRLYHEAANAT